MTTTICAGSGRRRSFSTGDTIAAGNLAGKVRRARVVCPACGLDTVGRVTSSTHGQVHGPLVTVPSHRAPTRLIDMAEDLRA